MKKGFTLIELIVVLIVISVGLVTLLLVLRNASLNNATAHFMTVASQLADGKMEEIIGDRKKEGFDYIIAGNYPQESFYGYAIDVDIEFVDRGDLNTPAGSPTDYKRVVITVNSAGIGTDVSLVTVVSDY